MNDKIRELFSSLLKNNTEATSQNFASIMKDKLNDALEIRKVGLTSKIFNKVEVQESVELEEGMTANAASKVTAAQIEKYIDSQNFKAIEQLTKFLSADEYELWSKNGFEGRTYELLMKQRAKNMKEAVEKIACLKCDAVSTATAWKKNKGFCPVCKVSTQGVAESVELEEATDADLKKVIDTAKKMGGKISGNTANFGKDSEITFSIEKGKIKFDGGKLGGVEYFNNVNDAIASLTIGLED